MIGDTLLCWQWAVFHKSLVQNSCQHTEGAKWPHSSVDFWVMVTPIFAGIGMDTCVIPLRHGGLSLVQTTDYIYPIVDDPYMMVSLIRRTFTSGTAYSGFGVVAGFRTCVCGWVFCFCSVQTVVIPPTVTLPLWVRFDCSLAHTWYRVWGRRGRCRASPGALEPAHVSLSEHLFSVSMEWCVSSFLLLFPCPCFSLTFVNSTFLCNMTDPACLCPEIESLASHHNELDRWPWFWSLLSPCLYSIG